jgi:flagellar L-ring protein precursor FlgH
VHISRIRRTWLVIVTGLGLVAVLAADARSQSSSLLGDPGTRSPLTLSECSWIYQPVEEEKPVQLNDLITVIVDEKSQVLSEGEVDRRKKADGTWTLKDWIIFDPDSLAVRPDPQTPGDPKISGEMNTKYRAEGELETRETMKFRIACRVVDIRPNGNLVLEGRRTIMNNDESWEMSLTGVIRPQDVLPNNTALSENIAELRIYKREAGHIRDGYRRGWFQKWLDKYQPF